MFRPDSPLVHLPSNLESRQLAFLVGVRYSAQMIDVAYRTLDRVLESLTSRVDASEPLEGQADAITEALAAAWTIVDSANRLRKLLEVMPGLKKSDPGMQLLLRTLRAAEDLRHPIQHLDAAINKHDDPEGLELQVWGALGWLWTDANESLMSVLLAPGPIRRHATPVVNPAQREIHYGVDHVTLDAYGKSVNLTRIRDAVADFVRWTEDTLGEQFADVETLGADAIFWFHMAPAPAQGEAQDGQGVDGETDR